MTPTATRHGDRALARIAAPKPLERHTVFPEPASTPAARGWNAVRRAISLGPPALSGPDQVFRRARGAIRTFVRRGHRAWRPSSQTHVDGDHNVGAEGLRACEAVREVEENRALPERRRVCDHVRHGHHKIKRLVPERPCSVGQGGNRWAVRVLYAASSGICDLEGHTFAQYSGRACNGLKGD